MSFKEHLLLPLPPIGCSFQAKLLLQLIIELLDDLERVPLSNGREETLWRRKTLTVHINWVHRQNWASFVTNFYLSKSVHDFVFRPWGETIGCVQPPKWRNQGETMPSSFEPKLFGLTKWPDLFASFGYDWNSMLGPKTRHLRDFKRVKIQGLNKNAAKEWDEQNQVHSGFTGQFGHLGFIC